MSTALQFSLLGILVVGGLCLSSCDYNSNEVSAQTQFETLIGDGASLDGKHIAIATCIRANPHGMELIDCSREKTGIPLEPSEALMRSSYPHFYEMALRSQVESKPPPKVYACGTFHLASRGDGRWLAVESMNNSGFPTKCRAKRDKSN
ncbi:hypothetical protein [Lysobacter sp. CA199]|uniref:hypothetical protein n=1 Tax=Lysobacter sp. CA199 TaxID=3455608 RepID=UPI003F8D765C